MHYLDYRPPVQQAQMPRQTPAPSPQPPLPPRQQRPAPRRRKRHPFLLIALVVLVAGGGVFLAVRNSDYRKMVAEVEAVQGVFLDNIYVDGIHLGGMTPQQAIEAVENQVNARQSSWSLRLTYQGHVFTELQYATLGIRTDMAQVYDLLSQLYQMGKTGSVQDKKREIDALKETPCQAYTTQSERSDVQLDSILSQIQEQLSYPATDAYLAYFYPDLEDPFIIQGESYGSTLDVEALKAEILEKAAAGESGDLEVQPWALAPSVTTADVRQQITLMYEAVTPVSSASTADRTSNIRVAFAALNGQTVEPGAELSFNQVVGPRTLEKGYKYAIEYVNGLEEVGVGGGVCQASTTLYLAALQSGLEITKREPHADAVSYTTFGQDATVLYTRDRKIDLAFKNTTQGTIYITAHVEEIRSGRYQCVVRIFGPSLGAVSYKLRTETVETISAPLEPTYQKDKNHTYVTDTDEEPYLARKARDGYINEAYLQCWENGVMVSETLFSRDTCKARAAIYLVGTENR